MKKSGLFAAALFLGFATLFLASETVQAQSQTAQSLMVKADTTSPAYQIDGTITWTYHRGNHNDTDLTGTAMSYYTNAWNGAAPTYTCSGGGQNGCVTPPATLAPAPSAVVLQQHAQDQRCIFFFGGDLTSTTYTQVAQVDITTNGPTKGNWKFTFTYNIAPIQPSVAAYTAWTSETTGGTVDISYAGFLTSESFLKQSNRNKYSFTMTENGVTRARNVAAQLQILNGLVWENVGAPVSLNNVDTDLDTNNDGVAVVPASADFPYFANGGIFGNSAVFGALHTTGFKPQNSAWNILQGLNDTLNFVDNFSGNNNDLAAGNIQIAPIGGTFAGLTGAGSYRILISGTLKGNSGAADTGFSVSSNTTIIGGCTLP
jgi:hypothetical protein